MKHTWKKKERKKNAATHQPRSTCMPESLGYVHMSKVKFCDPAKSRVLGTAAEHVSDRDFPPPPAIWLSTALVVPL